MKKAIIVLLALAFAFTLVVAAGCGGEESPAPSDSEEMQGMESTEDELATPEEMQTQMPDSTEMTTGYMDVSVEEARELIDSNPGLIVIDVSPHYAEGHLPGAVSYPLGDGSLDAAIPNLDKNEDYLVYCHIDSVAIAGAQKLIDAGFMNVYRLEGNYSAWVEAGYPVE
jgi:rhodanese-related sulfurtransferase